MLQLSLQTDNFQSFLIVNRSASQSSEQTREQSWQQIHFSAQNLQADKIQCNNRAKSTLQDATLTSNDMESESIHLIDLAVNAALIWEFSVKEPFFMFICRSKEFVRLDSISFGGFDNMCVVMEAHSD